LAALLNLAEPGGDCVGLRTFPRLPPFQDLERQQCLTESARSLFCRLPDLRENGGEAMRPTLGAALLLLGFALLTPSCMKLDFFKRKESPQSCKAGPRVGTPAPEIDGEDFDGKRVKLSDYRGKVVVVVFWASWCPPCRAMIPHERELAERYRDKPFVMLGVNNDEDVEAAKKIIAGQKMTWPIWKTGNVHHAINQRYGVECWPSVFVIDAAGVIRATGVTGLALDSAIATLLAEMESQRK
jgi:thiol-disulfide isomerase/thioredoxin